MAEKGHEFVVITPNPEFFETFANVTTVDISVGYQLVLKGMKSLKVAPKRGAIMNVDVILANNLYKTFFEVVVGELKEPSVTNLIKDKSQKFDLLVVEGFFDYQLIYSEYFKAPIIMMSSFMGFPEHHEMVGSFTRHPLLYPHFQRMNFKNLGYWELLKELYYEYKLYSMMKEAEDYQDALLKENFGPQAPSTSQLKEKVDMLLLASHPMYANNKPVPPNVIYFDSPQLQPAKALPQELKTYLDNSKRGVVYVSLGSNIIPSMMDKDFLEAFLLAFEALPYNILWKFDGDNLENVPKNVRIQKWFPQNDLLQHPNIKAFVTQCGLQSTAEAIASGVPLVGLPMMAEQWYNAQKYVDFGIGVKLDPLTVTAEDFIKGVNTVVDNKSYRENIVRFNDLVRDQPLSSLDTAVWWSEYVIRHGGAKHLRAPSANLTWREYFMVDFILLTAGALLVASSIVLWTLYLLVKKVVKLFKTDKKEKRKKKN